MAVIAGTVSRLEGIGLHCHQTQWRSASGPLWTKEQKTMMLPRRLQYTIHQCDLHLPERGSEHAREGRELQGPPSHDR